MLKKILFISIFLIISMSCVVAFEVPDGFEPDLGIDGYTNDDDENSGQVIDVYDEDTYNRLFFSKIGEEYTWEYNGDGTFDFKYDNGIKHYSGIGKEYIMNGQNDVVLFWNKNPDDGNDVLKELIAECDELNEDVDF